MFLSTPTLNNDAGNDVSKTSKSPVDKIGYFYESVGGVFYSIERENENSPIPDLEKNQGELLDSLYHPHAQFMV